jgi:hypothetical protein
MVTETHKYEKSSDKKAWTAIALILLVLLAYAAYVAYSGNYQMNGEKAGVTPDTTATAPAPETAPPAPAQ